MLKSFAEFKDKSPLQGLNTFQACYLVYNRHSEAIDSAKWNRPADIINYLNEFRQHSLRNPIVEQVVTETLRVAKDIWEFYGNGEKDFFKAKATPFMNSMETRETGLLPKRSLKAKS